MKLYYALFLVTFLFGFIVRVLPYICYSSYRSGWEVSFTYPVLHILRSGHQLTRDQIPTFSQFGEVIYASLDPPFSAYLNSIILIVSGNTSMEALATYLRYCLWMGVIVYPLAFAMLAYQFSKRINKKYNALEISLIYLYATLGNWVLLQNTEIGINIAQYGILLVLIFYLIVESQQNVKFKMLLLPVTGALLGYTHTASIKFLIILLLMLMIKGVYRKRPVTNKFFLFYATSFSSYYIYLFSYKFEYLIRTTRSLYEFEHLAITTTSFVYPQQYLLVEKPAFWWTLLFLTNALTVALPALAFFHGQFRGENEKKNTYTEVAFSWVLSIPVVAMLYGVWGGLSQFISRGYSYGSLIGILALLLWVTQLKTSTRRKALTLIALIGVSSAASSYLTTNMAGTNFIYKFTIKNDEWQAGEWAAHHVPPYKFIFTDFRLFSPLILLDRMEVFGITGDESRLIEILEAVYYHPNRVIDAVIILTKQGPRPAFLFFSRGMTSIGIRTMHHTYEPPPATLFSVYDSLSYFNKVYDNGNAVIYLILFET